MRILTSFGILTKIRRLYPFHKSPLILLAEGVMEYIKKEEIVETINKFIKARNCNCSKTTIIERRAFEYVLAIVNKLETHNFDEKD